MSAEIVNSLGLKLYDHRFGGASRRNLQGVHPRLIAVAEIAIRICPFDGTVLATGGVRNREQQAEHVKSGASKTMNSLHLPQGDGYGHAIDLVALTNGKVDWENVPAFRAMALAVQTAAAALSLPIRQGCDWDVDGVLGESATKEWDWPHFEMPRDVYLPRAIKLMNQRRAALGLKNNKDLEARLAVVESDLAALKRCCA
jgi:peptidoglycan LD-endopeptidase CwlK